MTRIRPIRVVYFVPEFQTTRNQLLCSQVLEQAGALQDAGFECMLVSSELDDESVHQAQAMPQVQALSKACILPIYPRTPHSLAFYRLARVAARIAESTVVSWKPDVVYVRGVSTFRPASNLARRAGVRVAYDARGLFAEEAQLKRGQWNLLAYYHRHRELEAWRKSDVLLCVSERFRTYLTEKMGRNDIAVVPCCVNERQFRFLPDARKRLRQKLGWSAQTPVVAYCGGLSVWQRIEDVLRLFAAIKSRAPALKCLLLTSDPGRMSELARRTGLAGSGFHCLRAPHEAIPDWLSTADAGIILRHNVLVNNVASPVKIAEYLACGLPVICSPGIGDLSDMVQNEQVGVVLADGQADPADRALDLIWKVHRQPSLRQQAHQTAVKRLTWTAHLGTYRVAYTHTTSASS